MSKVAVQPRTCPQLSDSGTRLTVVVRIAGTPSLSGPGTFAPVRSRPFHGHPVCALPMHYTPIAPVPQTRAPSAATSCMSRVSKRKPVRLALDPATFPGRTAAGRAPRLSADPGLADDAGYSIAWGCCGHVFHLDCISRWLKTRSVCPLCNREWEFAKIEKIATYGNLD